MSQRAALVFVIGLAALCVAGAALFFVWLVGAIAVDLYCHLTGQRKRIRRSELDASYRTGQFYVPPTMRDSK
jgi:hypothetical protein